MKIQEATSNVAITEKKEKQNVIQIMYSIPTMEGIYLQMLEAVVQRCSVNRVFLEILQKSQENTYARASFLIKLLT